jgi:Protein of unknown function (DUF3761)
MKALFVTVALGVGSLLAIDAFAADPPAGATALCKDGTYYTGTTHKGACKGHQGVKDWMDKSTTDSTAASTATTATDSTATKTKSKAKTKADDTATAAAPAATTAPAAATASSTTSMTKPTTTSTTKTPPTPASQITQKPGGGPGMVWVNSSSKVYHCQGDEWYGKTKEGSYMTEAAAKAAGNHGSHGKECSN